MTNTPQDTVLKWSISHQAEIAKVVELLEKFEFDEVEEFNLMYSKKIASGTYWREMKVRVRADETIFYLLKEVDETTETYFDYLVQASYLMGQVATHIGMLPVKEESEELPDYNDDKGTDLREGKV